jgi:hypothetical protein
MSKTKTKQETPKKTTKTPVSMVKIKANEEVLIDKVYSIGEHEISSEMRELLKNMNVVKKGIIEKL